MGVTVNLTNSINAALFYAEQGYPVFPCRIGEKRPLTSRGRNAATTDLATIESSYVRSPKANIGLVTDGLVAIDVDPGGQLTDDPVEEASLADAPTQETPRGGRHFIFRQPAGRDYRNTQSKLAPHVDTRANGGYILVAPSVVDKGNYRWIHPLNCTPDALPEPPDWLVRRLDQIGSVTHAVCSASSAASMSTMSSVSQTRIAEAIERTLPTIVGTRSRLIFHFARELWAIYGTKDVSPNQLEFHVREWHRRALPFIRTKPFEETWADFLHAWKNAKYPTGQEPISVLYLEALKQPRPECVMRYDTPELRNLVALCRELQRAAGQSPFFLDCRTAGRLIGTDRQRAHRWLTLVLIADGVLELTAKGSRGRASEYRYLPAL